MTPPLIVLGLPWFRAAMFEFPLPLPLPFIKPDELFSDTLPMQPFAVLISLAVLVSWRAADTFAKRNAIRPMWIADATVHVVVFGFAMAYLFNGVFYQWERVLAILENPPLLFRLGLGISSYGGFIGGLLGLWVWSRRRKRPMLAVGDAAAFAIPFGWVFARMGCAVVHDHPGVPTSFFLGIDDYEVGLPPFVTRHDLGLYEVFWALAVSMLLLFLARKKRFTGFYAALIPILYSPVRFFLDFLRLGGNTGDTRYAGLTPAQYAAIGTLTLGVLVLRHAWLAAAEQAESSLGTPS